MMTPRERVEAVLLRKGADRVPFTVYEGMIPLCETERRLRNEGLCMVRGMDVFRVETPDVAESVRHDHEDGMLRIRTDFRTPHGNLFKIDVCANIDTPRGVTTWQKQRLFKGPDDYKAIEFMICNRVYAPDYGPILKMMDTVGGDVILRSRLEYEPLQEILVRIMGIEAFSVEWANNRDELLKLYHVLVEDRRKRYPIVAKSPALFVSYGGNVVPEVVGPERFEKYILPDYEECAEIMHQYGKVLSCHLDANNRLIAPLIARSSLDCIEAFTPFPNTDMTVREALDAWPDKILWINFPSSVHLQNPERIEKAMLDILDQAKPGDRLIVGITEDVPEGHWRKSLPVISRVLNTCGKLPLK